MFKCCLADYLAGKFNLATLAGGHLRLAANQNIWMRHKQINESTVRPVFDNVPKEKNEKVIINIRLVSATARRANVIMH